MTNIFQKIIGDKKHFTPKHRVLRISFIAGIFLCFQATISNIALDLSTISIFISLAGVLIFSSLLTYSIIKRKSTLPGVIGFIFLILIFSPMLWITSGGINGTYHFYFILFPVVIIGLFRRKFMKTILVLLLFVAITLIITEYFFPEIIIEYPSRETKFIDFLINIPIAIIITALLMLFYVSQYKNVNTKLSATNKMLENQNEKILKQSEKIESQKAELDLKFDILERINKNVYAQNLKYEITLNDLNHTLDELKKTQKKLIEAEKMAGLGNLIAGVAHEINTPVGIGLQATSGIVDRTYNFSELLKKGEVNSVVLAEYLNHIYEAGKLAMINLQRSGELIKSFKQVSVKQSTHQLIEFNVKSYIYEILISLRPKFENKDIKIKVDCIENYNINSYPGIFAQIITNLIINSIKHGFKDRVNGQILIKCKKKITYLH